MAVKENETARNKFVHLREEVKQLKEETLESSTSMSRLSSSWKLKRQCSKRNEGGRKLKINN